MVRHAMKSVRMAGEVVRHEIKNVSKVTGEGESKEVVEQETFVLTVKDDDGHTARLQRTEGPWDVQVGEDVTITLGYGAQTKLEDAPAKKGKD